MDKKILQSIQMTLMRKARNIEYITEANVLVEKFVIKFGVRNPLLAARFTGGAQVSAEKDKPRKEEKIKVEQNFKTERSMYIPPIRRLHPERYVKVSVDEEQAWVALAEHHTVPATPPIAPMDSSSAFSAAHQEAF